MQIHTRGSHVSKLNPAFVWPPGSGEVVEEVSPYEDFNPEENMNDGGSYGYYNSTILGIAQSFTAHKGGKLTGATVWARRNLGNVDHLPLVAQISDKCAVAVGVAKPSGIWIATSEPIDSEGLTTEGWPERTDFVFSGDQQIQFEKDGVYCLAINRPSQSADVCRFGFYMGAAKQHAGQFTEGRSAWLPMGAGFDLIFYVASEP